MKRTKLGIGIGIIVVLVVVFGTPQLYQGALALNVKKPLRQKMVDKHFLFSFPNAPWLGNAGYKFRYTGTSEHLIGSIYDRNNRFIKNVCRTISGSISDVYCWWSNNESMWANGVNSMDGFYKFKFFEDTTNLPIRGGLQEAEPSAPQFRRIGESAVFELDVVDLFNP